MIINIMRSFPVDCHTMKVYKSIAPASISFKRLMWSLPASVGGKPTHCRKCEVASGTWT